MLHVLSVLFVVLVSYLKTEEVVSGNGFFSFINLSQHLSLTVSWVMPASIAAESKLWYPTAAASVERDSQISSPLPLIPLVIVIRLGGWGAWIKGSGGLET
uniref:Secreted protein n=1 Tax=Echinococcus granulosus TaxID=6210 RepID=A0A068WRC7_ECHGR|nr:hypothetical protein EgrG_002032600 [Echinococcus granulosus]